MPTRRPLSRALRRAIAKLPAKEKDRLIFRLLPGNPDMVGKLTFQLLADTTMREARAEMRRQVGQQAEELLHRYASPQFLLREYRAVSAEIAQYRKRTRDKVGEVELTLLLWNTTLPNLLEELTAPIPKLGNTLFKYILQRAVKLLRTLSKVTAEERLEQTPALIELGETIYQIPNLREMATRTGFDVNWLLSGEWPQDL